MGLFSQSKGYKSLQSFLDIRDEDIKKRFDTSHKLMKLLGVRRRDVELMHEEHWGAIFPVPGKDNQKFVIYPRKEKVYGKEILYLTAGKRSLWASLFRGISTDKPIYLEDEGFAELEEALEKWDGTNVRET